MASITLVRYLIECDGCLAVFGDHEARVAAYVQGWRFPSRLKANGQAGAQTSDVCAECLPDWQPRPLMHDKTRRGFGGRMLSRAEVEALRSRLRSGSGP